MDEMIIDAEVATVIDRLSHGEICPLETVLHYRRLAEVWEQLKKSVLFLDATEAALRKYGKQKHGTISMVWKPNWNYAVCGDWELGVLETKQAEAADKVKNRKAFLRALTTPVFDFEGTEISPPTCKINRQIDVSKIKNKQYI